jgi:DNA-binding MarR family transcriptional regulator
MKPDECIFFQMAKAYQSAIRFWGRQVEPLKVTASQAMVLNFLFEEDHLTLNRLGARTGLDSATLTGMMDRLASAGLLERKPNPHDRRAILICLTRKGRLLAGKLRKTAAAANRAFLKRLSRQEAHALRALLQKMRTA